MSRNDTNKFGYVNGAEIRRISLAAGRWRLGPNVDSGLPAIATDKEPIIGCDNEEFGTLLAGMAALVPCGAMLCAYRCARLTCWGALAGWYNSVALAPGSDVR